VKSCKPNVTNAAALAASCPMVAVAWFQDARELTVQSIPTTPPRQRRPMRIDWYGSARIRLTAWRGVTIQRGRGCDSMDRDYKIHILAILHDVML